MKRFVCLVGIISSLAALAAETGERTARTTFGTDAAVPDIVAQGRQPLVAPCRSCHLESGLGRPDNANLAGLPAEYIVRQVAAYKNNQRRSALPPPGGSWAMAAVARALNEAETDAAARYFAAMVPRPWIRVVETAAITRSDRSTTEAIGMRVLEVREDVERSPAAGSESGFVAYVPPGSLKRGEMLVTTGAGGRTVRCALCHGPDLRGTVTVPGIAGRSPSYLARQLHDMQLGFRFGAQADRMMGTVARLTEDDVVAIAAYAASLIP